ncbi:Hint domain-containing protein [Tateyamaria omphalii]|uniref:Hint domain-containing protein n=1 Tax=Tateyamaria omphalii TaxID=299262 RepID=UPI001C9985C0|nr:Hint domain-containing protein [Tateyamaria omphalii]MBY5934664.1 Hint domain-containing protein [Tateyamaria omphalii]
MPRISELHYSNAYARNSGVSEFLEVALGQSDDPADFVVGFYQADGSLGIEVRLDDPRVVQSVDPDNGEVIFVLSADNLPIFLTDPDGGGATNYEAYALTNTATGDVLDFYDIGGGTQNITAASGAAAGAVSENLPVVVGPEATTTTIQFNQPNPDQITYEALGPGDTGIACFVAGTMVDTPDGPRDVATLDAGDLVLTLDHGPMPLVWTGHRKVSGTGRFAPIEFAPGALGATSTLRVSPQHRVLIRGWQAELYFGADEILIPAKALVNGKTMIQQDVAQVHYVHLLFATHQIVCSNGMWSESYFPACAEAGGWNHDTEEELTALFPELRQPAALLTARPSYPVRFGPLLNVA